MRGSAASGASVAMRDYSEYLMLRVVAHGITFRAVSESKARILPGNYPEKRRQADAQDHPEGRMLFSGDCGGGGRPAAAGNAFPFAWGELPFPYRVGRYHPLGLVLRHWGIHCLHAGMRGWGLVLVPSILPFLYVAESWG